MAAWRRRRYDPRYDDPYAYRGRRSRYRSGGGSCWRDACLLETGCCLGEAIESSCLVTGLALLPRFLTVAGSAMGTAPARQTGGAAGGQATRPVAGLVAAIRLYQREISARRRPCCRFTPSCSEYAAQALHAHGTARGLHLAARRLLRCRPGGAWGSDPVPNVSPAPG